MSTDRQLTATDVACLALACALAVSACASSKPPEPIDWTVGELVPVKQPDWYILQHEQVHFAIMQVAALTLTKQLEQVAPARRTRQLIRSAYSLTLLHVRDRHREFDLDTSGTFRPDDLEKWVRILEIQMHELCGPEDDCPVRLSGD